MPIELFGNAPIIVMADAYEDRGTLRIRQAGKLLAVRGDFVPSFAVINRGAVREGVLLRELRESAKVVQDAGGFGASLKAFRPAKSRG